MARGPGRDCPQTFPVSRRQVWTGLAGLVSAAAFRLPARAAEPLRVVTTTAHLGDAARVIGGERVRVQSLFGAGVDPHLYKPTRSDIQKLAGADLILAHGLHLEAQFDGVLSDLARRKRVVLAADALPRERLLPSPDFPDRFDPHVWMDPDLWGGVVDTVRDALVQADPEGRPRHEAAASAYRARLAALADYMRGVLNTVPADARVLVTAHDAFEYFGRAFGLEVHGIQGLSTESEAGLKRIEELVALLVQRRVRAVFVESSVSDRNMRALLEGAAARGGAVKLGGELFSDALGEPGTWEGEVLGMLDHNATIIARGLGGDAPEGGFRATPAGRS